MIRLNGQVVGLNQFPDGTIRFTEEEIKAADILHNVVTWNFESERECMELMFLTKYLKENSASWLDLKLPYLPHARMDRVKSMSDVFTLKYFADFINSLEFSSVIILDPHSPVSEALIHNIVVVDPQEFILTALRELKETYKDVDCDNLTIFYPDEGAMKRYSGMLDVPYTFGVKNRDWKTGEILGLDVIGNENLINGKNILMIDDICSQGGTFYHSAKKLKELGAKHIFLYVTHCEDTIHRGELLKGDLIDHIYTTDSILKKPDEKITMYPSEVM